MFLRLLSNGSYCMFLPDVNCHTRLAIWAPLCRPLAETSSTCMNYNPALCLALLAALHALCLVLLPAFGARLAHTGIMLRGINSVPSLIMINKLLVVGYKMSLGAISLTHTVRTRGVQYCGQQIDSRGEVPETIITGYMEGVWNGLETKGNVQYCHDRQGGVDLTGEGWWTYENGLQLNGVGI